MVTNKITMQEIRDITGLSDSAIRDRLRKIGAFKTPLPEGGFVLNVEDSKMKALLVPKRSDPGVDGLENIHGLAAMLNLSEPVVRGRLNSLRVSPDMRVGSRNIGYYRVTEDLLEKMRKYDHPARKREHRESRYAQDLSSVDVIAEEREKRAWVGRRGYFVTDGQRRGEGVITHVSMMGCYIGKTFGTLKELRLE